MSANAVGNGDVPKLRKSRRSRFEIVAKIIEATLEPAILSDIVYRARLNFSIVHKYTEPLIEAGLLQHNLKTAYYKATELGLEYLKAFHHVKQIFNARIKIG